jgi:hypothetical protein
MLWIQALLNVLHVEDRTGIAEYDHFGHLLLELEKSPHSVPNLHKQLDVTRWGGKLDNGGAQAYD